MEQQEYLIKLQMLEQQANQFGEQLKVIEQQVHELNSLKDSIGKLNDSKGGEMFSEVGKGIYIKGELKNKEMLVDVGHKILVPKTVDEIEKIVGDQVSKFEEIKKEISTNVDHINQELDKVMKEAHSPKEEEKKK